MLAKRGLFRKERGAFSFFKGLLLARQFLNSVWFGRYRRVTLNVDQTQDRQEVDAVPCDLAVPRHRIFKQPCIT